MQKRSLKILRKRDICALMGNPPSTFYLKIKAGLMTKPVLIGLRSVGWPEYEGEEINAAYIAGKSDDEIRDLVKSLHAQRRQAVNHAPSDE